MRPRQDPEKGSKYTEWAQHKGVVETGANWQAQGPSKAFDDLSASIHRTTEAGFPREGRNSDFYVRSIDF